MPMRTAIVLAGRHDITDKMYRPIVDEFKTQGWDKVIYYGPDWDAKSVEKLISDFLKKVPDDAQPLTLLGFSLGAMIALIAAEKLKIENLILCSPSGYFQEYDTLLTDDDRAWADKELTDFRNYSAVQVIRNVYPAHGVLLAGESGLKQWPDFKKWVEDLKSNSGWKYIELAKTGHEIESFTYQAAIRKVIHDIASNAHSF